MSRVPLTGLGAVSAGMDAVWWPLALVHWATRRTLVEPDASMLVCRVQVWTSCVVAVGEVAATGEGIYLLLSTEHICSAQQAAVS